MRVRGLRCHAVFCRILGEKMNYQDFLENKRQYGKNSGFDAVFVPNFLFDFQMELVFWSVKKGRSAIFADCGLGKTPIQLVWAENIVRKTNRNVLIATPLSVSFQTIKESEKFDIEAKRSMDGKCFNGITVTNYEKLHLFNPNDFVGMVCDESSILKNFDGARKQIITDFMKKLPYRLLCTATAAPNDYIELGTSSEALGELGYMDMLNRFFKNNNNTIDRKGMYGGPRQQWRFKKHATEPFWRWVCSWAKALRRPSDIGYPDDDFILPPLKEVETVIACSRPMPGRLFVEPATSLKEQRIERRYTLNARCEKVAEKVNKNNVAVVWCQLNDEGDLLEKLISGSKQVKGSMTDGAKEETFLNFLNGDVRVLITKPKIGAFGLNWQHCAHMTFFPSHSYEQYYQGVRRCWRFGQKKEVVVDIVTTEGETAVLQNLQRKAAAADEMFDNLVKYMNYSKSIKIEENYTKKERIPSWL